MKRRYFFTALIASLSVVHVYAGTCVDLTKNVSRYQENSNVKLLQTFLFERKYLQATPNGYFGAGTFAAVKAFQKEKGLSMIGAVGPATRALIKKESCGIGPSTTPSGGVSQGSGVTTLQSTSSAIKPLVETRNDIRWRDAELILKALHRYFVDSRGVYPLPPTSSTTVSGELCVVPKGSITSSVSSSTNSSTLTTKDSPCLTYVDVSYLTPSFLSVVPTDPSIATTSITKGYIVSRDKYDMITVAPKTTDDKAIIKVSCSFSGYCREIKRIRALSYDQPEITSINRNIVLRDATPKTPLIIRGNNFTEKNNIKLFSVYNGKEYDLGTYSAKNYTATTTVISIEEAIFGKVFACGSNCAEKMPLGDYMLSITNEGGVSNTTRIALRGFTTSSLSTQVNSSVIPTTKNVKVATITISSSVPVSLKTLTLTSSSTSKNLPGKISNFVLKDTLDGTSLSGGSGTFSFSNVTLYENQSRAYDVYVDTAEVLNVDAGLITYSGKLLVSDSFAYVDMELPIKEFSFTVSH